MSALMLLGGCDPDADGSGDGVELRSDPYFILGMGFDPIPGGGACEECVTDAVLSGGAKSPWKLELCIDGRIDYVGTSRSSEDDVPLRDLLNVVTTSQGSDWKLVSVSWSGLSEATLCNSDDSGACVFEKAEYGDGSVMLSVEYNTNRPDAVPELLRFVPSDALLGAGPYSPGMKIPAPRIGGKLACGGGPKASGSKPESATPPATTSKAARIGLAHITARFPYGGVRSCSGVLIASNYVLTARHCLPVNDDLVAVAGNDAAIEVRMLDGSGVVDPSVFSIAEIVRHPDPARDLALARLDVHADTLKFPVAPNAALQTHDGDVCTMAGRGFGRSEKHVGFDWGNAKSIPVRPAPPEAAVYDDFHPDDLGKLLLLENVNPDSHQLCRGDSGGPIVQTCGGQATVVGIASSRVFESEDVHRIDGTGIEPMMNAFAFSHGNTCGVGDLVVYAATRIDAEVQAWIAGVIGASIPPQPQPVTK